MDDETAAIEAGGEDDVTEAIEPGPDDDDLTEAIEPDPDHDQEAEVFRLTQLFTDTMTEWILRYPENYFWVHRRFKSTPPDPVPYLESYRAWQAAGNDPVDWRWSG